MNRALKFIIAALLFASCGGNPDSVHLPNDFSSEKIISKQNHLQKILTKQMVAKIINVPIDKIQEHLEHNISNKGPYTILYSWATGNKNEVAGGKHQIAEYHSISIGFVKQMSIQEFEYYYGTNQGLQKQVNEMTKQENFNRETGTVEAKYIAEYARRRQTQKLESVATMAFWETPINALHVLAKDAAFTLTANFGKDQKMAKEKLVELTSAILNP